MNVPNHVAVILDGNGRWAKSKGLPRKMGHVQGGKNVEDMLYVADELGIKYFTVYAFSTENWKRSEDEVAALMTLLRSYLLSGFKKAAKNNVRIRIIGDKTYLAPDIQQAIAELEADSEKNTGLQFQIAINYGGRDELLRMMKRMAASVAAGELTEDEIEQARSCAELFSLEQIMHHSRLLDRALGEMQQKTCDKRICAELTLVKTALKCLCLLF